MDYKKLYEEEKKKSEEIEEHMRLLEESKLTAQIQERERLEVDNNKFRGNISRFGCVINVILARLYKESPGNKFIRKAFHLSIVGIICSEVFDLPPLQNLKALLPHMDLNLSSGDTWASIDKPTQSFIMNWMKKFHASSLVLPEALISSNLWYSIIRVLILSIEESCDEHRGIELECFGEFKAVSVGALGGGRFLTDLVFMAGCSGLPVCMVEMSAGLDAPFPSVHKDFKKLAVQMGGVMFQLIGAIRKRGDAVAKSYIPSLRIFGALIFGTKIQFCCIRPQMGRTGKFFLHFETRAREWTFDLFQSTVSHAQPVPFESKSTGIIERDDLLTISTELEDVDTILAHLNRIEAEEEHLHIRDMMAAAEARKSQAREPYGDANIDAVKSVANFVGHVHEYFKGLPDSVRDFYETPGDPDPDLVLTERMHEHVHTSAKSSTADQREEFAGTTSYLTRSHIPPIYTIPTLPCIHVIAPTDSDNWNWVVYDEGISLSEMAGWIESAYSEKKLSINRVLLRSRFLMNILTAIYKANELGWIFTEFYHDNITFKKNFFSIKTYRSAESKCTTSTSSLAASLEALSVFYYSFWFLDGYMTGGDDTYSNLRLIEWAIFGKISKFAEGIYDWKGMLEEVLDAYNSILEEARLMNSGDPTKYLIQAVMGEINKSERVASPTSAPAPHLTGTMSEMSTSLPVGPLWSQSVGSSGSSIEHMKIIGESKEGEEKTPAAASIVLIRTEELEQLQEKIQSIL